MVIFYTLAIGYFKQRDEIYINLDNDLLVNDSNVLTIAKILGYKHIKYSNYNKTLNFARNRPIWLNMT